MLEKTNTVASVTVTFGQAVAPSFQTTKAEWGSHGGSPSESAAQTVTVAE